MRPSTFIAVCVVLIGVFLTLVSQPTHDNVSVYHPESTITDTRTIGEKAQDDQDAADLHNVECSGSPIGTPGC